MGEPEIEILLALIDQAFDKRAWHGTNLKGSIRGLDVATAAWRPSPGRHNIWELILHSAYWKYIARRRLLNEDRGSFPLTGSNFITRPSKSINDASGLKRDVALLNEMHVALREAVSRLRRKRSKPDTSRNDDDDSRARPRRRIARSLSRWPDTIVETVI